MIYKYEWHFEKSSFECSMTFDQTQMRWNELFLIRNNNTIINRKHFSQFKHFDKYMFVKREFSFTSDLNNFERSLSKNFSIFRDERKIAREQKKTKNLLRIYSKRVIDTFTYKIFNRINTSSSKFISRISNEQRYFTQKEKHLI